LFSKCFSYKGAAALPKTAGGNASLVAGLANQQILLVAFVLNSVVCCKINLLLLVFSSVRA